MHHEKRTADPAVIQPPHPHIYRKNEWDDLDDYREDLSAGEILEYENEILALIQKEKLPSEGERGLAVYLDDDLNRKVYSINPSVEEWNGELWGVTEVQTDGTLSPSELAELKEWLSGQFSDGWCEGLEQRKIKVRIVSCMLAFGIAATASLSSRRMC